MDPESPLAKHHQEFHNSVPETNCKLELMRTFRRPLERQTFEGIKISSSKVIPINRKGEWGQNWSAQPELSDHCFQLRTRPRPDQTQTRPKRPNASQEPPASSKAQYEDLQDIYILCTFKIMIESQNLEHGCIKDQWPFPKQDQDAWPKSGTSSIFQSPKSGLKWHGCSLDLQNKDRIAKFGLWMYQRPVTLSKLRSICQTQVRSLQHHSKPKIRSERTWIFLNLQN